MNAVAKLNTGQLALVKRTIAGDCNDEEFDLFVEAARSYGLDPFRKQIIPLVFGKNAKDQSKRRMSIVVTRDGLRILAQRCGNYRPASKPAEYIIDEGSRSPTNPLGIVCARVTLWQRDDRSGDWYEVAGEAYWDEFAPIKKDAEDGYDWVETGEVWPDTGKPKKKKVPRGAETLKLDEDGNWGRMPRVMIAKCAEAQALRAGWPDQFSGVYVQEEMDRAVVDDMTASQALLQQEQENRLLLTSGANSVMIVWLAGMPLEPVPVGTLADRILEWINDPSRSADQIDQFTGMNTHSLREFWAKAKNDALGVRNAIDRKLAELRASEAA
ncbi:phage recombination protein Bet [Amorphus sp. MBR-141]